MVMQNKLQQRIPLQRASKSLRYFLFIKLHKTPYKQDNIHAMDNSRCVVCIHSIEIFNLIQPTKVSQSHHRRNVSKPFIGTSLQ